MEPLSYSQLRAFLDCEARGLALATDQLLVLPTDAMLCGSYVDAAMTGDLDRFKAENPEIFRRDGKLRADFDAADRIVDLLLGQPLLRLMLDGAHQVEVSGLVRGVPFRGRIDSLLDKKLVEKVCDAYPKMLDFLAMADGAIVDLKVVRSLDPVWTGWGGRLGVVEANRWDLQLAIYQRLVGGRLPCFVLAATRETHPDLRLIYVQQYMLDGAVNQWCSDAQLERIAKLKGGTADPLRCEKCEWCRMSRVVDAAICAEDLDTRTQE